MIFKGFKQIGIQYISQSIESYLSVILGSQAKTKQPIISARESARETQQKFRKLVSDTILNYDVSMSRNNKSGDLRHQRCFELGNISLVVAVA